MAGENLSLQIDLRIRMILTILLVWKHAVAILDDYDPALQ